MTPNERDRTAWNHIFANVPLDWRSAPPSRAMVECSEFLHCHSVRSVLDLGCGIGRWAMHFARAGLAVSATDFACNGVEHARAWSSEEGLAIRFACQAITEEPFAGEQFDAVVAALVLDNIAPEEMRIAIGRMRDALCVGGVAFALFNPFATCSSDESDNPTAGLTRVAYSDAELRASFPGFDILDMRVYEAGTRGIFLQLAENQGERAAVP